MRSQGGFAHFAAVVAAAAGASTIPFLSSFCGSGLLWGIRWSQSNAPESDAKERYEPKKMPATRTNKNVNFSSKIQKTMHTNGNAVAKGPVA
jgi:hypothetical protein